MQKLFSKGRYIGTIVSMDSPEHARSKPVWFVKVKVSIDGYTGFLFMVGNLDTCNMLYGAKEFYIGKEIRMDIRQHELEENCFSNSFNFVAFVNP